MDVKFYEVYKEEKEAIKRFLPSTISAEFTCDTVQESSDQEPPATVISTRTQSIIPAAWAGKLKGVFTRSRGYDQLTAYQQSVENSIVCGSLPSYCARAVGEHAIMAMMALLRKLPAQMKNFPRFYREGLTGRELKGRKVLVVGVGNIGREIVDIARSLQMDVKGVDIEQKVEGLPYVEIAEGLSWAEIIFLALPLTHETQDFITFKEAAFIQPQSFLINIARGELMALPLIQGLLDQNILAGVALDVFPKEDILAVHLRKGEVGANEELRILQGFLEDERVLLTPHNAFNTQESTAKKAELSVQAIVQFLSTGQF